MVKYNIETVFLVCPIWVCQIQPRSESNAQIKPVYLNFGQIWHNLVDHSQQWEHDYYFGSQTGVEKLVGQKVTLSEQAFI